MRETNNSNSDQRSKLQTHSEAEAHQNHKSPVFFAISLILSLDAEMAGLWTIGVCPCAALCVWQHRKKQTTSSETFEAGVGLQLAPPHDECKLSSKIQGSQNNLQTTATTEVSRLIVVVSIKVKVHCKVYITAYKLYKLGGFIAQRISIQISRLKTSENSNSKQFHTAMPTPGLQMYGPWCMVHGAQSTMVQSKDLEKAAKSQPRRQTIANNLIQVRSELVGTAWTQAPWSSGDAQMAHEWQRWANHTPIRFESTSNQGKTNTQIRFEIQK